MSKHSINNSHKLMSSGHDSLSKRQSLFSHSKEISPEEIINTYDIKSHKVNNSPEMSIASFGDFNFTFEFARLINSWVNTSEGYKFLWELKRLEIGFSSSGNIPEVLYVLGDRELGDRIFLDKAVTASRPILHGDKDSKTQSTYDGYGRQGTDFFKGSKTQMLWRSPAYPVLMGKTQVYIL